jgi:serine/threonine protein kinase
MPTISFTALPLKPGYVLKGRYRIIKPLETSSSYAHSYTAINNSTKKIVFIKLPKHNVKEDPSKIPKNEIIEVVREAYQGYVFQGTTVDKNVERFQNEAQLVSKFRNIDDPRLARILDAFALSIKVTNDFSFSIPVIVQEFIEGDTLEVWANREFKKDRSNLKSRSDQSRWVQLAKHLSEILDIVHHSGIVHGDIWPSNIIVKNNGIPVLVDFGESFLIDRKATKTNEPANGSNLGYPSYPYMAPERRHGQYGESWFEPADIYSLGGTLHWVATGEAPPPPAGDGKQLKQQIMTGLSAADDRASKHELYRANPYYADLIIQCLQPKPSDRAPLNEILALVDCFERVAINDVPPIHRDVEKAIYRDLQKTAKQVLTEGISPVLCQMLLDEVARLRRTLEEVRGCRRVEISGSRGRVITSLLSHLSLLGEGDAYEAVTTPRFWGKHALGSQGRFYRMNELLAENGVIVTRIFILTEKELNLREGADAEALKSIMSAQQAMAKRLLAKGLYCKSVEDRRKRGCFVGFHVVGSEAQKKFFGAHAHAGLSKIGRRHTKIIFRQLDESEPLTLSMNHSKFSLASHSVKTISHNCLEMKPRGAG